MVTGWQKRLVENGVPHKPGCDIRATLQDPVKMRTWKMCGLPQDAHSVENAIIMETGGRYPLFIDPEGQANVFVRKMAAQAGTDKLDVTKLSDKDFLRKLENGVHIVSGTPGRVFDMIRRKVHK